MLQREIILQRVKKLLKHAESAKQLNSLEEAEAFMLKANQLMTEYNLSLSEVDATQEKQEDEFKNYGYSEELSFDDKHQGFQWKLNLMSVITRFNYSGFTFKQRSKTLKVYGRMENVDVTVWLYNFLMIGLFNLAHDKYKAVLAEKRLRNSQEATYFSKVEAYTFKRDFLTGAIDGIEQQLRKQRDSQTSQVNALIVRNDKALNTYLHNTATNLRSVSLKQPSIKHSSSYHAGLEAGLRFNINKPLSNSSSKSSKLIS